MFWGLNVFGQLFSFAFHELIVQEDANQRAGFVGVRQRDEALIFQFQASSRPRRAAASMVFTAVIGAG